VEDEVRLDAGFDGDESEEIRVRRLDQRSLDGGS
jgi:hypothetical protein